MAPPFRIADLGDSLSIGFVGNFNYRAGGLGSWSQLDADRLGAIAGLGQLASSGVKLATQATLADWTFTGAGWATAAGTEYDRSPYGAGVFSLATGMFASGATNIATYTVGKDVKPGVGLQFFYVDYTDGSTHTAGNWSWRITPIATGTPGSWTNMGQTIVHDNKIGVFYVAQAVAVGDIIEIRGADSSGTAAGVYPYAIETWYQTPSTATGLIVDVLAVNGSLLHDLVNGLSTTTGIATGNTDRLAIFDQVKLGSGSPVAPTPNVVISGNINDVLNASVSTFGTDETTLYRRVTAAGATLGIWSPYECDTTAYTAGGGNGQSDYRDKTKERASTLGFKTIDIYDVWAARGITGYAQTVAAGFLLDGTHESQAGHFTLADTFYWWLRNQFLSAYVAGNSNPFTLGKSALGGTDQLGGTPHVDQAPALAGIASTAAVGSLQNNLTATFAGIASTAGVGALTAQQTAPLAGIASTSGVGALTEQQTAPFAGIAPTSDVGSLTFAVGAVTVPFAGIASTSALGSLATTTGPVTVALTGIASSSAVGALAAAIDVTFGGIASSSAVGTLATLAEITAGLGGIASTAAVGTLGTTVGPVTVGLTGISSTAAVGTLSTIVGGTSVAFGGIASTSAVGTLTFAEGPVSVGLGGIASSSAVGSLTTAVGVVAAALTGIASTAAVGTLGTTTGPVTVTLTGIASTAAVGNLSLGAGDATVTLTAIDPTSAVGSLTVSAGTTTAALTGVASTSVVGSLTAAPGAVSVILTGVGSSSAVGSLVASAGGLGVDLGGIASSSAVGSLTGLPGAVTVTFTGIASTATVGTLTTSTATTVALAGIASTSAVGTIGTSGSIAQFVTFVGIASTSTVGALTFTGAPSVAGSVRVRPGPSARVAVRPGPSTRVAVQPGLTVTVAVGGSQ
jgi:hypothetical protein